MKYSDEIDIAKNEQLVSCAMKRILNNALLLPTLLDVVNDIDQYCYTRFTLNNQQYYSMLLLTTTNNAGRWWAENNPVQICYSADFKFFSYVAN